MKADFIILKPLQEIGKHDGSSFMELLDLWHENDFCWVRPNVDIRSTGYVDSTLMPEARPWINEVGDVLLYNQPILDKLPPTWNHALFANEILHKENCSNWIFWPRWVRQYYRFQNEHDAVSFGERIESVFIGNFTTRKRSGPWGSYIERFIMGDQHNHIAGQMKVPYPDYLSLLSTAKYGLCLPGVGPKCLRDVELMGLGTVPIFTPDVSTDYHEPLLEGRHFVYVDVPEKIPELLRSISKEKWRFMSSECQTWFARNCSLHGSFETTVRILESMNAI